VDVYHIENIVAEDDNMAALHILSINSIPSMRNSVQFPSVINKYEEDIYYQERLSRHNFTYSIIKNFTFCKRSNRGKYYSTNSSEVQDSNFSESQIHDLKAKALFNPNSRKHCGCHIKVWH
jgi:hypothetical protein